MTDNSGDLTLTDTGVALFLKLTSAVASVTRGSVSNGTCTTGDTIEINDTNVVFVTSTGGVTSISNAVTDINNLTSSHKVTATAEAGANTITSDIATYGSAYGLVGGYVPYSASINGTTVNFTSDAGGQAAYGIAVGIASDMATDINTAGISNIIASESGGMLVIKETTGGSITLVNISTDGQGNNFAGNNGTASLNTSNPASGTSFTLQLKRVDGGEIILKDSVGTVTTDFGILSGHNGSYALGLHVEQGIRKAGTTVVATIAARNAITSKLAGDSVHILDTGEGEWAQHLWDGSAWTVTATQDSAATDANSLSHTFTAPIGGFGTSTTVTLGRISSNSRVLSVLVEVLTVISGYSGGVPSLEVGTSSDPDRFMGDAENDLEFAGSYTTTPDYHYAGAAELELKASLDHYNASAGSIKVTVTYV
jgi:hypothetical protein